MLSSQVSLPSLLHVVVYGVCSLAVYFAGLAIYRVFFHPLARYPGPLSYRLSSWPLVWQAYGGDRHIRHLEDHEKYGPVVRIAPDTLSFNTATALNAIYGPRTANVRKGEWYKTFDSAAGGYSSFTETDKEKHVVKRKWVSPAFSAQSMGESEVVVNEVIERFCDTIGGLRKEKSEDGWGLKWNASQMTTYLGFDMMGRLVFGCDFKTVQEKKNRQLAEAVLPATKFLYWVSHLPMAFLVRPLLRTRLVEILGGKPVSDMNGLIDYATAEVRTRQAAFDANKGGFKESGRDWLSRLVGAEDKKTGWRPSIADLDVESLNMILAGADPFSGVMAGALFYLAKNDTCLKKVTEEVRSAFSASSEIHTGSSLNSCIYLQAVLEESLRRCAPVPSHMPRNVLSGGMKIDNHYFPADTVVGVPCYSIHHNADYFPSPWTFSPERWIASATNPQSRIDEMRRAFEPFGLGTRGCVGKNLAYMEMKLTLAHLLWRFDVRESPEEMGRGAGRRGKGEGREREDEFQLIDAFGFGRDGPMVEVRARQ